ncbi:MAG TPA: serine/threonine-protein kinase, partial [Polyangiaceae bacterium]|nr:serine/threonine-protein kinase [Polyangiaceae bacterium]
MSMDLAPGTVFATDFRIVRPLSEGGMGSVYVVEQLSTGARRALKLMRKELVADASMQARFLQEARASARIASDHVVQVISAGVDGQTGMPWLAMELLVGEELDQRVKKRGPLSRADALEVVRQLAHALAAAHAVGLVHRDLKPNNLFLADARTAGASFSLKILDFGIAKLIEDAQASATMAIGTPLWMAPEQTEQRGHVSAATDVWAVGLIVFYLLTGRVYWMAAAQPSTSMQTLLREMLVEPIVPPSRRAAELGVGHLLPNGFDAWFLRLVERDPQRRENDIRRALQGLEAVLGAQQTAAAGPLPMAPAMAAPTAQPMASHPAQNPYASAPHAAPAWTAAPTPAPFMQTPAPAMPARRSAAGIVALAVGLTVLGGGGAAAFFLNGTPKKSARRRSSSDDDEDEKDDKKDDDKETRAEEDRKADCATLQVFGGRVSGTMTGIGDVKPDPADFDRTANVLQGLGTQARELPLRTDAAKAIAERAAKAIEDIATSLHDIATAVRTSDRTRAEAEAQKLQSHQAELDAIDRATAEL